MSQWEKTSTASQIHSSNTDSSNTDSSNTDSSNTDSSNTDSSNTDMPGHNDQDVCICIACQTRCRNNTALRKHGAKENHRPYGCVCGDAFARLYVLGRHIASKNKVTKFHCPLCEYDETVKAFTRADHLPQHLRTFHKIPAGIIPEDFTSNLASDGAVEYSTPAPQSMTSFPCLIPGCMRTGELAYLRQIDLDEHMAFMHCAFQNDISVQQQLSNPVTTWTNHDFQQNADLPPVMTFGQDAQQNGFLQPDPVGDYQIHGEALGNDVFVGNSSFLLDDNFAIDFEMNLGLNI
ncbi:hypothetical protein F4782DRAFT_546022 [Xylaria castorea]|nr:hypothetical protein F4782DRAFT_546022 [Xylaria castorea]